MSGRKMLDELGGFFEDLRLRLEPNELYTKSELYRLYKSSFAIPDNAYAESTFSIAFAEAVKNKIIDMTYMPSEHAWVFHGEVSDDEDKDTSIAIDEEVDKLNKELIFQLLKNEISIAFRHVAENMTPEMIKEVFKDQIQLLVKQEFKTEILPIVMSNLEKLFQSSKEELSAKIDEKMDPDVIKENILLVIRNAFEYPISMEVEDILGQTEES